MRIGEEDTTKRKKVTKTSSSSKKQKTKQKNKQNKQKKAADLHAGAGCLSRIQDNTEPGA